MAGVIYELFDDFLETVIAYNFLLKFNNNKWKGNEDTYPFIAVIALYIFASGYINKFSGIIMLIQGFMYYLCVRKMNNKSTVIKSAFSCALLVISIIISSTLSLIILTKVFNMSIIEIASGFGIYSVSACLLCKVILFIILYSYIPLGRILNESFNLKLSIKLLCIPIMTLVIMSMLMSLMVERTLSKAETAELMILVVCILIIVFGVFNIYVYLMEGKKSEIELSELKQKYNFEKKQLNENIEMYNYVRTMKHNMKNYLLCVGSYLKSGDIEGASNYLGSINYELDKIKKYVYTSNENLNYIINSKFTLAQEKGIECSVTINEEAIKNIVNIIDFIAILGNLLDNAIEASVNVNKPKIVLDISYVYGCIAVSVKNKINQSVLESNPFLKTTKKNKTEHGLGIASIKYICKKNNGNVNIYEEKDMFIVDVILSLRTV